MPIRKAKKENLTQGLTLSTKYSNKVCSVGKSSMDSCDCQLCFSPSVEPPGTLEPAGSLLGLLIGELPSAWVACCSELCCMRISGGFWFA